MRRLLMIAYRFPPDTEVGRIRTLKFCKYLPEFGWEPVVVACAPPPGVEADPRREIPPGTEVHRVPADRFHPWLQRSAQTVRRLAGRLRRHLRGSGQLQEAPALAPSGSSRQGPALTTLLHTLTYWPDNYCTANLAAARKAIALSRGCSALYSSGNPASSHVVAMRAHRFSGLPWIMDYRDPWVINGVYEYGFALQRSCMQWLEHRCVGFASRALQVTDPLTEMYRRAYPDQPLTKFSTMPNGFDPDDFADLPQPAACFPMSLTYLGSLSSGRNAGPLIEAVALLSRAQHLDASMLRINLIGFGALDCHAAAESLGVRELFHLSGPVPYRQALEVLGRSDAALLIGGPTFDRASMPTKVYEYFAMKKPILAAVPEGHLARELRSVGAPCVGHDDVEGIAEMLGEALGTFRRQRRLDPPRPLPDMGSYTRRHLAGKLAAILDEIAP